MKYFDILLNQNGKNIFTYSFDTKDQNIVEGNRALVPIGSKEKVGIILKEVKKPEFKTKSIVKILDSKPLFSKKYFSWIQKSSQYYLTDIHLALKTALPSLFWKNLTDTELKNKKTRKNPLNLSWIDDKQITLNSDQEKIYQEIKNKINKQEFSTNLLHGITGSGKTEIYLKLAQDLIDQNKSLIILVPEIGLTPQMLARFHHRFSDHLGVFHSGLTENQKNQQWHLALENKTKIIIGTRSSLFLPVKNLGLIIVDEEHDHSFKQEDRFRYHARDLSILRSKFESIPILLGSATPSLESYYHCLDKKFELYSLNKRGSHASLPKIKLIDMKTQKAQTKLPLQISVELYQGIGKNLIDKKQTLILLNRRGFAQFALCMNCESSIQCPNCELSLTYHKTDQKLKCHYCLYHQTLPKNCSHCDSKNINLIGQGTQLIEKELREHFPKARIKRLDKDTSTRNEELFSTLKELKEHQIDILIGTQMIAKGHDIPNVTLVGIIGADSGLNLPDFRASEKVFQMLVQVAGRSGRGIDPGLVIIQSYTPDHYSIKLSSEQDYEGFIQKELENRKELNYPPYSRLIQFQFSSLKDEKIIQFLNKIQPRLNQLLKNKKFSEVNLLGPSRSLITKLRNRYRWQFVLKSSNRSKLHLLAYQIKKIIDQEISTAIRFSIDVDPLDIM
jgi:primosomal protein N' (replication factor Y)